MFKNILLALACISTSQILCLDTPEDNALVPQATQRSRLIWRAYDASLLLGIAGGTAYVSSCVRSPTTPPEHFIVSSCILLGSSGLMFIRCIRKHYGQCERNAE
jgi:hypothetical protein